MRTWVPLYSDKKISWVPINEADDNNVHRFQNFTAPKITHPLPLCSANFEANSMHTIFEKPIKNGQIAPSKSTFCFKSLFLLSKTGTKP